MSQPPASIPPPPGAVPPPPGARSSAHGRRRAVAVAAALGLAAAGATVAAVAILHSGGSGSPSARPARSAPAKPRPPAALPAARLAGDFVVAEKLTWARGFESWKKGTVKRASWAFAPVCKQGACPVRLTFTVEGTLLGPIAKTTSIRLKRSGAVYQGSAHTSLTECQLESIQGTMTVWLRVMKGAWVGERWTAAKIRGSVRYSTPETTTGIWVCQPTGYTATFIGNPLSASY